MLRPLPPKSEKEQRRQLEKSEQFQWYDDVCVQLHHFEDWLEDMRAKEEYLQKSETGEKDQTNILHQSQNEKF